MSRKCGFYTYLEKQLEIVFYRLTSRANALVEEPEIFDKGDSSSKFNESYIFAASLCFLDSLGPISKG